MSAFSQAVLNAPSSIPDSLVRERLSSHQNNESRVYETMAVDHCGMMLVWCSTLVSTSIHIQCCTHQRAILKTQCSSVHHDQLLNNMNKDFRTFLR
jgi:hypothetical protein